MIPLASSARNETVDWIAKTVVIRAIMTSSRDSSASTPVPRRRSAAVPPASVSRSVIALTTEPNSRAPRMMVAVQPMMGPRCSRSASPSGVAYRAGARGCGRGARGTALRRSHVAPPAVSPPSSSAAVSSDQQQERPPSVGPPRLHLLAPPDGRGPGEAPVAQVADHPQDVEHAEDDRAERVRAARGRRRPDPQRRRRRRRPARHRSSTPRR